VFDLLVDVGLGASVVPARPAAAVVLARARA